MESRLIALVSRISPWIATIPTAYAIGHAVYTVIGWPAWVAVITAAAIETMGIGVTNTGLELYAWNRGKRKSDPIAPLWLAAALIAVYYTATIILTAVLERNAILALFPALSAVAAGTLALRADQAARVAEVAALRAEKRKLATVETQPPAKPAHVCKTCGKSYEKQTSLAAHMRHHAKGMVKNG